MKNEKNYLEEREKPFTPLLAIEEASRCLLCHDAPCSKACPAESDPAKFIRSLRFRNIKGAAETLRSNNILSGVCARVCPTNKYCEGACSHCDIDKPIQIAKLQRYITEYELNTNLKVLEPVEITKDSIAIIGSGPSGLSAASALVQKGYDVTVFEQREQLGGWLSYGIPSDRLPQALVDQEIDYIKMLGVNFETNKKLGKDFSIEDLKAKGFKSILIAIGNQNGKDLDINGINLEKVEQGCEFLAKAKTNPDSTFIGKHIVVIGGGDVAMDCASTAKRFGCEDVKVVYRRSLLEMPASPDEKSYLQDLSIPVFTGFKPHSIIGSASVEAIKAVGFKDNSELVLPADHVLLAIGQKSDDLKDLASISILDKYKTNDDSIFVSGDCTDGDKTVVDGVKQGKDVAKLIMNYLESSSSSKGGLK